MARREPYTSPLISLEDAAAHFKCCRPVVDPVFATSDEKIPGCVIIAGALMDLQARIERHALPVVERKAFPHVQMKNRSAPETPPPAKIKDKIEALALPIFKANAIIRRRKFPIAVIILDRQTATHG